MYGEAICHLLIDGFIVTVVRLIGDLFIDIEGVIGFNLVLIIMKATFHFQSGFFSLKLSFLIKPKRNKV